jgi:hypothetical protein
LHSPMVFAENQPPRHLRGGIFCLLLFAVEQK